MALAIFIIFSFCIIFSFLEEKLEKKDKLLVYVLIGIAMIVTAGSRSVYDTPDSDNYEWMYYSVTDLDDTYREPTFVYLSYYLQLFGLGVNALFFAYALLAIPLRLGIIWKMSKLPLVTLGIYISFYYQLHDLMQMRCAVASALFLYALYFRVEKMWLQSIGCILIGTLFHYSAITGLVIFLFNNEELKTWQRAVLYLVVPAGVLVYFSGFGFSHLIPYEWGGDRMETYRTLKEYGEEDEMAGWLFYKHPIILSNIFLYYACIYYHKLLTANYKYTPIMIKIMAVAFVCMLTLGDISAVLASRLHEYFEIVSIFLWTAAIYAFHPLNLGKIIINSLSALRCAASVLFYALGLYGR